MRRGIIRGLWGDVASHRNGKIAKEIQSVEDKSWFTVYVFGADNYNWLKETGFNVALVDRKSSKWDLDTEMYRHKLAVFERAMRDFDEIVFLDWDCVQTGSMDGMWEKLNEKEVLQANLFMYRTKKCLWRTEDHRKVCNGGFVYMRDKKIPHRVIKLYDELYEWVAKRKAERAARGLELRFREKALIYDDEPAISKYIDDYLGGWKGAEHYWENFEPSVCNLRRKSVFSKDRLEAKNACFLHRL